MRLFLTPTCIGKNNKVLLFLLICFMMHHIWYETTFIPATLLIYPIWKHGCIFAKPKNALIMAIWCEAAFPHTAFWTAFRRAVFAIGDRLNVCLNWVQSVLDNVNFRKKRASFSAGIDRCTKTSTTQTHHLSNPAAVLQLNHVQLGPSPPTPCCSSLQRNDPWAPEVFPGKCVGCSAAPIHCTAKSTFFIIFHLDIIQMCNFIAQNVHICPNMWIACARHFVSHLAEGLCFSDPLQVAIPESNALVWTCLGLGQKWIWCRLRIFRACGLGRFGGENLRFQGCFKETSEIAGKYVEQGEIRPRESNTDFVGSLMEIWSSLLGGVLMPTPRKVNQTLMRLLVITK